MISKTPIRYSKSWEDYKVIEKALKIEKNDKLISIIASGDNLLNLLINNPKKIYGIDDNKPQIYELKLKINAIKNLGYFDFINLMGYNGNSAERLEIFNRLSKNLDDQTLDFWNRYKIIIKKGLAFQGYTEKRYRNYGRIIRFLLGNDYQRFITSKDRSTRENIFKKRIDKKIIKVLSIFFTNKMFLNLSYHKKLLKNLSKNLNHNDILWQKIRRLMVEKGCKDNPYLFWFFTNKIPQEQHLWQPYLRKENYQILKNNISKIEIIENDIHSALRNIKDNEIDCFYLSDIFDWMDEVEFKKTLLEIYRVGKNNSKMINLVILNDRPIPDDLKYKILINKNESYELLKNERVGLYQKIYLSIINK